MPQLWPHLASELDRLDLLIEDVFHSTERAGAEPRSPRAADSPLAQVAAAFDLTDLEVDLLVLAIAPEADPRYQRVFAALSEDRDRTWPTPSLAHRLVRGADAATVPLQDLVACLAADGRLARTGLIRGVSTAASHAATTMYAAAPALTHFCLGVDRLPDDVTLFAERVSNLAAWEELGLIGEIRDRLEQVAALIRAREPQARPAVLLGDADPVGARAAAGAVARALGHELLAVDITRAHPIDDPRRLVLPLRLRPRTVFLHRVDTPHVADVVSLADALRPHGIPLVIQCTSRALTAAVARHIRTVSVDLVGSTFEARERAWDRALAAGQVYLSRAERSMLAERFDVSAVQMRAAVQAAVDDRALAPEAPADWFDAVVAATRRAAETRVVAFAAKVHATPTWNDLVLPSATMARLRELGGAVRHRRVVYSDWQFNRRTASGTGVKALFAGPSGTGKTLSAAVLAHELGLDLYRVDLSGVVSKYIGETEKHLDEIFASARGAQAMVFFDEADALFGKRSEVRDSHDRYANIEVSYLLQKLEEHDGVVILATNLRGNIDEAFARRLHYVIDFAPPDQAARERLWRGMFPDAVPIDPAVDWRFLAGHFQLSGGDIRNVSLDAAFLAAQNGRVVTMQHLVRALGRQIAKQGKLPSLSEFQPYQALLTAD